MSVLPPILQRQHDAANQRVVIEMDIPASLPHFSGHFDDHPILPGIAQLDWAIALAREVFPLPQKFQSVERLKFNAPVFPPNRLQLTLEYQAAQGQFNFSYCRSADGQTVSSGRVRFSSERAEELA
ncbi:MAG: hypothetical protein EPO06_03950 [Burkholderiaceae bacterium]|nr:MAG: hypothetical protein EPO06_03950 [Burkholderiaceae bacterium]